MFVFALVLLVVALALFIGNAAIKLVNVDVKADRDDVRAARNDNRDRAAIKSALRWAGSIGVAIGVLLLIFSTLTVVPAGHVGVIDVFGSVSDQTLDPGINFVNPLARVVKMNTQTQESKETMESPTKEGGERSVPSKPTRGG